MHKVSGMSRNAPLCGIRTAFRVVSIGTSRRFEASNLKTAEITMQARTRAIVQLVALVGVAIAVAGALRTLQAPKEFRGTVRYLVRHAGDEGSQAVLVTSTESFDLFCRQKFGWKSKLERIRRQESCGHRPVEEGREAETGFLNVAIGSKGQEASEM